MLDNAIRDAVGKLDPAFGYADAFDEASSTYSGLIWTRSAPEHLPSTAVLVKPDVARTQSQPKPVSISGSGDQAQAIGGFGELAPTPIGDRPPSIPRKPRRFFGAVELDMVRPIKSFEGILNAVVMELQRTSGTSINVTIEIDAEATDGFDEADVGVVRDNVRQLKFKPESTGFE